MIEWFGDGGANGGLSSNVYYPTRRGAGEGRRLGRRPVVVPRLARATPGGRRYHVFSVEWTPTAYVFRSTARDLADHRGRPGTPEYLILSLLSSDYELPLLGGEDRLPQHLHVDWAAFWEA